MRLRYVISSLVAGLGASIAMAAQTPTPPPEGFLKLRDPFKKPAVTEANGQPKSELEQYSLEQFKLVGVLTGPKRIRAMVLLPNGKNYIVGENMHLGMHKGVLTKITPDALHVKEKIINVLGQEEDVETMVRLVESATKIQDTSAVMTGQVSQNGDKGEPAGVPTKGPDGPRFVSDSSYMIPQTTSQPAPQPAAPAGQPTVQPAPVISNGHNSNSGGGLPPMPSVLSAPAAPANPHTHP